jgi:hypothetical protein
VKGEEKINASALFPYDVTKNTVNGPTANALWKQLPDYVPEGVSFLPVIDTSSSMTSPIGSSGITCMDASISLGIYLAERNKSAFKNLALTFNSTPRWINVPVSDDIQSRVRQVRGADWGGSTDLDKSMDLILSTALANDVPASDMPDFLIVISDMEFNSYGNRFTAAERTKSKFESAGYKMPNIVWWNVQSRGNTTPVRFDERGMVMVSGLSPAVTKSVLAGDVDPKSAMLKTIADPRYEH